MAGQQHDASSDSVTDGHPYPVAGLIHDALWAEGGETVEGAFVDRYVSNASLAYDELNEWFNEHGFSAPDADLFRQAMRREPTERMVPLLDYLRTWTGPVVLEMLDDAAPTARATALGVARRFRPVKSLIAYLKDPDAIVRAAALNVICDPHNGLPRKQRTAYLEQACADPGPEVRRVAGLALIDSNEPEARKILARLIESESDRNLRDDLVMALAPETARNGIHVERKRLTTLLGPALKAILMRELNHEKARVREAVTEALARLSGPDVGTALLDRLAVEESGDVRFAMRHYGGFAEVLDRALEVFSLRMTIEPEPWIREELTSLRLRFFREVEAALRREEHDGEQRGIPGPSPAVTAAIQRRIDARSGENSLSIFSTSALYEYRIQPDGTVLCVDRESIRDNTEVVPDGLIRFAVIVQGAARYPELRELIPTPPAGTRLCKECEGVGSDAANAGQSCPYCSGYGWRTAPPARPVPSVSREATVPPDDSGGDTTNGDVPIGRGTGIGTALYSPLQLPDLPPDSTGELRLEWDHDGNDIILRHAGVTLWRERTGKDGATRFAEIAEVLRGKYGASLKDLMPTPAGVSALLGDGPSPEREEAANRVAAARASLGTAPETRRYDVHSLEFSIRSGQREQIRRFLAQGDDPTRIENHLWERLLRVAAERREAEIVRMLLCAGADPDSVDGRGWSPLAYALEEPYSPSPRYEAALAVAWLLVEAGASLDVPEEARQQLRDRGVRTYKPPLAVAARYGNVAALRFLLACGANPNAAEFGGRTALHDAVFGGFVGTARLLCDAGADPNAQYEPPLWTPLHAAIYSSDARNKETTAPLIRLLAASGADIDRGEEDGDSPLFAAISEARHDLVLLLLELGANVHHRNDAGEGAAAHLVQRTRMRMLSEEEMLPILQTLLSAGVDPGAVSKTGQSAYDLAREYNFWDIAAYLKAA